jgi:ABC-2 type transport system permease protein
MTMELDQSIPPIPAEAPWQRHWRVTQAMVRKDLTDLRYNTQLMVILAVPFLVFVIYRLLTIGVDSQEVLPVAIWDQGQSQLISQLEAQPELEVHQVVDMTEMSTLATDDDMQGLIIPMGFDIALAQGERPELQVYLNNQAGRQMEVERFRRILQEQTLVLAGQALPAEMMWEDAAAITGRDPFSSEVALNSYLFTIVLTLALYMVGANVVSHLMAEEKEKKTVDSLLTAPATAWAYILSKAILGMWLGGIMFGLMILFNGGLTGRWLITIPFVFLSLLAFTGLGILTGILSENTKQCNTWTSLLMFVILMPSWFGSFADVSEPWHTLFRLIPTHYLVTALTDSLEARIGWVDVLPHLLIWLVTALCAWLVIGWLVRTRPQRLIT